MAEVLDIPMSLDPSVEFEIEFDISYGQGGKYPDYEGEYVVTPAIQESRVLPTAGRSMTDDLTITQVPYAETSNIGGGITVTIGLE